MVTYGDGVSNVNIWQICLNFIDRTENSPLLRRFTRQQDTANY